MVDIQNIVQPHILKLKPYSSARSEFEGSAEIMLDANENCYAENYNRYPDSAQKALKQKIAALKKQDPRKLLLGNGSDECIDLLIRACCKPERDRIVICPPVYGMYEVCAGISNIGLKKFPLDEDFQPDVERILNETDRRDKIIFICSPNNPTGNSIEQNRIEKLIKEFPGLVVVDEAYIDYSEEASFIYQQNEFPNLVVLQTFSKAWALAGIRLGMLWAAPELVEVLERIKPPYNISAPAQEIAKLSLDNKDQLAWQVQKTTKERKRLADRLLKIDAVEKVYPSSANFLLVKFSDANSVYNFLKQKGIIVRNRSNEPGCKNCLRITVGKPDENNKLIETISIWKQ